MTHFAYVDGQITPVDQATVSVRDRGFLFGDGVYEVVGVYEGRLFRLDRHLERLHRSAEELDLEGVPDLQAMRRIAGDLVDRSDLRDGMVYIQVTRGAGPRQASPPDETEPTTVLYVDEARRDVESVRADGAKVILVPEIRWERCDIKSVNLLPKVQMSQRASRQGAYEAIFRSESGLVYEGTSTNLFIVDDGKLRTPDDPHRVLPGITRREIIEIASMEGIPVEMNHIGVGDLYEADEVFLTGTLTEVLGVVAIDDTEVGGGEVGDLTRRLHDSLRDRIDREAEAIS